MIGKHIYFLVALSLLVAFHAVAEPVLVGGDHDYPPYEYLDDDGQPAGYNVALTRAIAEAVDLDVKIELGPWNEIREALESGQIDAIHGMFYSKERDRVVDFSSPHAIIHHVAFAHTGTPDIQSVDDLRGKSLIVMQGDIMHDFVLEQHLTTDLLTASSQAEALRMLDAGQGKYALAAKLPGLYWIDKLDLNDLRVTGPVLKDAEYCYAVREGQKALLAELNEGLAILHQTGEYREIYDTLLGNYEQSPYDHPVLRYSGWILLILFGVLAAAMAWSWSLRREVANKTRQLQREIAEKEHAEMELRDSQARFLSFMDHLPGAAFIRAQDGTTLFANEYYRQAIAQSKEDVGGKHYRDFLTPEMVTRVDEQDRQVRTTQEAHAFEDAVETPNGRRYYLTTKFPIHTEEGNTLIGAVAIDITARRLAEEQQKQFEEQLRHSQKLESLGVLAGGIAHDFNNLLMTMLGNADLALQDLSPANPARHSVAEIERAARRAAELCKQMLAYSGKGKFVSVPLDINEVVEEMAHLLEVSISKKAVLHYNLAKSVPLISADPTQIHQIVMNLITNASEAIGERSGVITISTGTMYCSEEYLQTTYADEALTEGNYVSIEVSDNGCGMDEETRQRIFDPFFTTKFTGRGLGLAAALGIVRSHKGAMKVYSEPGQGTSFKLLLPALPADVAATPASPKAQQDFEAKGTILLVDDEEAIRALGKRMIERMGFDVILAEDGRKAVQVFKDNADAIDCVLLDLTMPHMDGEEAFRELRAIREDVRVVLCSGYNEQDISKRFVGRRLAGFVQKPYQSDTLRQALKAAFEPEP